MALYQVCVTDQWRRFQHAIDCSIESQSPFDTALWHRQHKTNRLIAGVAQHEQMPLRFAVFIQKCLADQHTETARVTVMPFTRIELMTFRMTPADILVFMSRSASAFKESIATQ